MINLKNCNQNERIQLTRSQSARARSISIPFIDAMGAVVGGGLGTTAGGVGALPGAIYGAATASGAANSIWGWVEDIATGWFDW